MCFLSIHLCAYFDHFPKERKDTEIMHNVFIDYNGNTFNWPASSIGLMVRSTRSGKMVLLVKCSTCLGRGQCKKPEMCTSIVMMMFWQVASVMWRSDSTFNSASRKIVEIQMSNFAFLFMSLGELFFCVFYCTVLLLDSPKYSLKVRDETKKSFIFMNMQCLFAYVWLQWKWQIF